MTTSKRPLSPHLQIYKPQLTSLLSISHRITGVGLSIFSIIIPVTLLSIALGEDIYNIFKFVLNHHFFRIFLILIIFTLSYHLANGIRHLFWDLGIGLNLKETYLSGYIVLFFSIIITLLSVYLFLAKSGF